MLDVACGNGNATLLAAATGARVTGLDITPELLDVGRAAAPEIDWVEGDAEALPFPEAHFDVVISTFGCMFAPDHERTANEIRRVVKPGGRIAIACWAPDGAGGAFFGRSHSGRRRRRKVTAGRADVARPRCSPTPRRAVFRDPFFAAGRRLRLRLPAHGGGAVMSSIRCPAGSRTVQRGASHASSSARTVKPASVNARTAAS